MKLLFFGTSDFSKPVFEALKEEGYSPILWDLEKGIEEFKKMEPDICIVAAYGKIIPKEYLEIPKYGFLNIHPSLLPKYRGPSPIQTAILNGEKETGITIILMDEKIDHGPVLVKSKIQITNNKKYKELEKELAELGTELLIEILPKWINRDIKPIEQDHNKATYTKKFSWPDGKIDWSKPADLISRQINALNPEPGTWTEWNGRVLKISDGDPVSHGSLSKHGLPASDKNDNLNPGQVFLTKNNEAAIKCGSDTALLPKTVQLESRKTMGIDAFLNGQKNFVSSVLK